MISRDYIAIEDLVETIIDNRGKTVPIIDGTGIPLIATNCIKFSSIYPVFENIRYIAQDTYDTWFRAHLQPNDILFVNKGTPGRCCITPDPVNFVGAQDMVGLRFRKEYHPFYMLAVIRSKEVQETIQNNHVGLVIAHFRKQELVKLKLPILDKKIRDYIGEVYKNISYKIELNNKINTELEAMAKTLYDYWFVQFDFPDKDGKPYKSSGGKMVWNEILKRAIPEGWKVLDLQEIAKCVMGQSPKGESYNLDKIGIPLLNGPADYENGVLKGRTYTTEPTRLCQKNDLVLCIRATIGNLVYSEQEFCLGRGVAAVRPIEEKLSELIYFLLLQEIERFKRHATGSIIVGITKDDLIKSKCLIPNDKIVDAFHKLIKPQFDKIRINLKENQELASLRDWLLPMLMNGQIRVGDINESIEEKKKSILNSIDKIKGYPSKEENLGMVAEDKVEYKKS